MPRTDEEVELDLDVGTAGPSAASVVGELLLPGASDVLGWSLQLRAASADEAFDSTTRGDALFAPDDAVDVRVFDADSAGVLLSPGTSDPLLRKTVRVSMGRVFDVPWARATSWPGDLAALRELHGFRIVAAEDLPGAMDVADLPRRDRTVVVFGAEGAGVSREVLAMADAVARIPMSSRGGALADDPPSLNAAVASAVMLDRLCAR